MTVPALSCPWNVTYDDVLLSCASAPTIGVADRQVTRPVADSAVAAAVATVWAATGQRFGVCTRTARFCRNCGRSGGCTGRCSSRYYDRLDLDPFGRDHVVAVVSVTAGVDVLTVDDYALLDGRWLMRLPSGTRWPTQRDVASTPPDIEVTWQHGTPPPVDLLLNGVIPLACDLAKASAGLPCSIPPEVVSLNREGANYVMRDVTALVLDGKIGPPSTLAAITRAQPWGTAYSHTGGIVDPSDVLDPPFVELTGGPALDPVDPEFDRVRGDAWRWSYTTTQNTSDWSNLVVYVRTRPTRDAPVIVSSPGGIDVTGTDFAAGRLEWLIADTVTSGLPVGEAWIEVQAIVPAEGGERTIMPARRLRIRDEVAV